VFVVVFLGFGGFWAFNNLNFGSGVERVEEIKIYRYA